MTHKEIVAYLVEHYQVGPWWRQSVTVAYEQARGMRAKHEMPSGYQISRSKTIPVSLDKLYTAWQDPAERLRWLPGVDLTFHKETPHKLLRALWTDGLTTLDIAFYEKEARKSQVVVQHNKLENAQQAEEMKAYWSEALSRLEKHLTC
jgi:uncharacterized protein YndB with AHSA1/START domain